jgi:serine/threonine protein kinase
MLRKSSAIPSLSATIKWPVGVAGALVSEPEEVEVDLSQVTVAPLSKGGRTTVLPRRATGEGAFAREVEPRFQHVRMLGAGAMGEVELVRDNDIQRTVAVKQIRSGLVSEEALLRFADEVRVVGRLEHPGIVPVYDVGRGEDGQVYQVMKHLEGETMDAIIGRLKAGDPACVDRFTPEYRARIFLGVLEAMRYAHEKGVLHRDLKPANIMIGPYGEVTVLDWGIAKPIGNARLSRDVEPLGRTFLEGHEGRLIETRIGSLAGTPLYMSPEQAAGMNGELDERSDVYSLCVVLYEWLVLRHPLEDRKSVPDVLAWLVLREYSAVDLAGPAQAAGAPMEYVWIVYRGLMRGREERYQSVKELETAIKGVLDGKIRIQCHFTLAKSYAHRLLHWIDRHPKLYTNLFRAAKLVLFAAAAAIVAAGFFAWRAP